MLSIESRPMDLDQSQPENQVIQPRVRIDSIGERVIDDEPATPIAPAMGGTAFELMQFYGYAKLEAFATYGPTH